MDDSLINDPWSQLLKSEELLLSPFVLRDSIFNMFWLGAVEKEEFSSLYLT